MSELGPENTGDAEKFRVNINVNDDVADTGDADVGPNTTDSERTAEFEPGPSPELDTEYALSPEDKHGVEESQAKLALEKAVEAGYMTPQDVEDYFGTHPEDILTGVASYIEMTGHDTETVMRQWGIVE